MTIRIYLVLLVVISAYVLVNLNIKGDNLILMKNISILASGSGTNAENIIRFFQKRDEGQVNLLMANRKDAYALERARKLSVPAKFFGRDDIYSSNMILDLLSEYSTDLIVLAGFLWLIPSEIIKAYPVRILNIHPALLPSYGGKGMYGRKVHEAVIAGGEEKSGISIHLVNEEYDRGDIIFQAECPVLSDDTADTLANRIHELEYEHYPGIILEYLKRL